MKDHKRCEMYDGLDSHLGRCLKNWAAYFTPARGGRERLLKAAQTQKVDSDGDAPGAWILYLWPESEPKLAYKSSHLRLLGPITQSRMWSFHQLTVSRLAT